MNIFIPITGYSPNKKGGAVPTEYMIPDDLSSLGVSWWYNWNNIGAENAPGEPEFVPMSWGGEVPRIPGNNVLVFNEPDNRTQSNLTPQAAALRYSSLSKSINPARLIVGGVTYWHGYRWLSDFIAECTKIGASIPTRWHIHGYTEWGVTPNQIIEFWENCHAMTGGNYWVTEFGDPDGNADNFMALLGWLKSCLWVDRYAAFASRVTGSEWWYPESWPTPSKMALISDGLTDIGKIYAEVS